MIRLTNQSMQAELNELQELWENAMGLCKQILSEAKFEKAQNYQLGEPMFGRLNSLNFWRKVVDSLFELQESIEEFHRYIPGDEN